MLYLLTDSSIDNTFLHTTHYINQLVLLLDFLSIVDVDQHVHTLLYDSSNLVVNTVQVKFLYAYSSREIKSRV